MNGLHEAWGERIRERRSALKLTQYDLAELAGCAQSMLSKIEAGVVCPSDELKWKIAGALRMRVDRLFAYPSIVPPVPSQPAA
jgi:transcriptional regulator with XRE-family HTH domain